MKDIEEAKGIKGKKKGKKKKHILLKLFIVLLILIISICLYSKYYEVKSIKVKEYRVESNKLPLSFDGVKIVHFSDLNYGSTIFEDELENVVNKINELNPDIVVFTGNLIYEEYDYSKEDLNLIKEYLSKITSVVGKYAVSGLHDNRINDYDIYLNNAGFNVLNNEYDLVYYKGYTPIYLTGLTSYLTTKIDLNNAFKYFDSKKEEDEDLFKIVLVNESDAVDEIINKNNTVDLILSGNTLGGLIRIPFVSKDGLLTQDGSSIYKSDYIVKDNTNIYVNSGIGTNSLNMRLFNYPSISLYRLNVID